jgi:DGQHR domain-containing protein
MKSVGELFLNLGFEPLAYRRIFPDIGEIDFVFKIQREGFQFVFILEVSSEGSGQNRKIDHFFSRWVEPHNLDPFLRELHVANANNMRVFIDLSRDSKDSGLTSIQHHLVTSDLPNRVLFKDDLEYFLRMYDSIGRWAKSDLLSYLHVPMSQTSVRTKAIQFYLEEKPAFCFVSDVSTLLASCYISRRLGGEKGYQRALNASRLRNIKEGIEGGRIVAFPNSILINCEDVLLSPLASRRECPKSIEINLPTNYCSCCVVDGQHRLLGFSQLEESELSQRHLPVVAFQQLSREKEVRLFVDINSKQKRIDTNLILDLKADFLWDPRLNQREFTEKLIVMIARELHKRGSLKGKIFFGGAREVRKGKVTLSTFVSILEENQLIGGNGHYWQSNVMSDDLAEPLNNIKEFFSSMLEVFHSRANAMRFLMGNLGLRIVFRTLQVLERNRISGRCNISKVDFIQDLYSILNNHLISELQRLYGVGGKVEGSKMVIAQLRRNFRDRYGRVEIDFRRLSRR